MKQTSTGQFFSLEDTLTYPNYMLGEDAPVVEAEDDFGAGEEEKK